jgi:small-conductance mechanosensitive channel
MYDTFFSAQMIVGSMIALAVLVIARIVHSVINTAIRRRLVEEEAMSGQSALGMMGLLAKGALWTLALTVILANFGINVTSLIAGLGIGGIAIALASQNILSDLLSSFAIYADKPFQVGDSIQTGSSEGRVEKIGLRTTRLRGKNGEEIVLANRDLSGAMIRNYGRATPVIEIELEFSAKMQISEGLIAELAAVCSDGRKGIIPDAVRLIGYQNPLWRAEMRFFIKDEKHIPGLLLELKRHCDTKNISLVSLSQQLRHYHGKGRR